MAGALHDGGGTSTFWIRLVSDQFNPIRVQRGGHWDHDYTSDADGKSRQLDGR